MNGQRKTKTVQSASPSDPGVPQPEVENRVQAVSPGMGSKISPVAEGNHTITF